MRSNAPARTGRRKPRLLIVEDDPDLRVLVQFAAKRAEVFSTIATAEDGQAALDIIRASLSGAQSGPPPDLVFTDYNMPKLSGLELAHELRTDEQTSSMPVALFTAELFDPAPPLAEAAGCRAVYRKPANFRDLLRIMKALPRLCVGNAELVTCDSTSTFGVTDLMRPDHRRDDMQRGAA